MDAITDTNDFITCILFGLTEEFGSEAAKFETHFVRIFLFFLETKTFSVILHSTESN